MTTHTVSFDIDLSVSKLDDVVQALKAVGYTSGEPKVLEPERK